LQRQSWRKALIFISFLLFPLTIYYFSPMLIIMGATEGIVATSLLVFTAMLIFSLVFGRLFCAACIDVCPQSVLRFSFSRASLQHKKHNEVVKKHEK
jgi:ferredoxin-type protein NapH